MRGHSLGHADLAVDNSGRKLPVAGWFRNASALNRSLSVISRLTTEFRQSKYGTTVVSIEPVNEARPNGDATNMTFYQSYLQKVRALRCCTVH